MPKGRSEGEPSASFLPVAGGSKPTAYAGRYQILSHPTCAEIDAALQGHEAELAGAQSRVLSGLPINHPKMGVIP